MCDMNNSDNCKLFHISQNIEMGDKLWSLNIINIA